MKMMIFHILIVYQLLVTLLATEVNRGYRNPASCLMFEAWYSFYGYAHGLPNFLFFSLFLKKKIHKYVHRGKIQNLNS